MSGIVSVADVYIQATYLSHENDQVVGEKNDYYVTLEQLEHILQKLQRAGSAV